MTNYKEHFTQPDLYFQSYVRSWTQARWQRFYDKPHETDIAAALLASDNEIEKILINFFCNRIGHTISENCTYRLIRSNQLSIKNIKYFDQYTGKRSQIVPDMFLVYADSDELTDDDLGDFTLLASIELKRSASVNGKWNYCPQNKHSGYSNQIICYAYNCWIQPEKLKDLPALPTYIWLAPEKSFTKEHPKGAISPSDKQYMSSSGRSLGEHYEAQQQAWKNIWHHITIEEIIYALQAETITNPLGELIQKWVAY